MGALAPIRTVLNDAVPGLQLGDILLGDFERFVKGFVFEIVDTTTGRPIRTKSLVLNPQVYNLSEPFALTLTPAEDNSVVAEENGIIIREITLEGTTGLKTRKEEALGRGGQIGTEASGTEHFKDLRELFREYSTLKKDPNRSADVVMIFHNIKEDDHFVVVPRSFDTPRDAARNRVHFNYRISLAAIQELPLPTEEGDPFGINEGLRAVTRALNTARAFMVETINEFETLRRRINNPSLIIDSLANVLNTLSEFVESIIGNIAVGRELFFTTIDLLEAAEERLSNNIDEPADEDLLEAARRFGRIRAALTSAATQPEIFQDPVGSATAQVFAGAQNFTNHDLENNLAGATIGTRTRLALGSESGEGIEMGGFIGSLRHIVQATDTIDSISARFRIPREAIIELNSLVFPYITRGGAPNTLKPGDVILIPQRASARQNTSGQPNAPYLTPDEVLYGVDIKLDPKLMELGIFDIKVDEAHGAQDVEVIGGVPNVVQGVSIIVNTEKDTTNFLPGFGVNRSVGIKGLAESLMLASINLREGILSDSRITGIDSMRIVRRGDVMTQEITPILTDRRDAVTLAVPFGAAAQG